jgi:hypothetical protein
MLPISDSLLAEMVPNLRDLLVGGDLLRLLLQVLDDFRYGLVDAALEVHRSCAGRNALQAATHDGGGENGGGGAVACDIVRLEATSRIICAPMFSNLSASSIWRW